MDSELKARVIIGGDGSWVVAAKVVTEKQHSSDHDITRRSSDLSYGKKGRSRRLCTLFMRAT